MNNSYPSWGNMRYKSENSINEPDIKLAEFKFVTDDSSYQKITLDDSLFS